MFFNAPLNSTLKSLLSLWGVVHDMTERTVNNIKYFIIFLQMLADGLY